VERKEDGLPCFGVEVRWSGRCGGKGSAVESAVAEAAWSWKAVASLR
jgi:hypothetical protein